ncbi:MAG: PAS-domain containing protein [Chakrabartia sp.]
MVMVSPTAAILVGALLAVWLAASAWALATGLAMQRRASQSSDHADRLALLLEGAPASPVVVRANDKIEAQPRLMSWLGLRRMPQRMADLSAPDAGLMPEDLVALNAAIAQTRQTARPFSQIIVPRGGTRRLAVQGAAAPGRMAGQRAVTLWLFDITQTQAEIEQLRDEVRGMTAALGTASALLEAAPFPIWYRDADLRLVLVNTAYVDAVEATSAEDAVRRGIELSDSPEGVAAAAEALTEKAATTRIVPATLAGERRAIRIVNVPLEGQGVAGYAIDVEEVERARAAFRRFAEAQRDTLDRLSAAVAQFAPDHGLIFCNRPFQQMFALKLEWVTERPDFDRLLDRMREARRVPETRDFPAWKEDRRQWFTHAGGAIEESWVLPGGAHVRLVAQPLPDGGLLTIFEDRTEQTQLASARDTLLRVRRATLDNLFEAIGVFEASGRLTTWNTRFRDVWEFEETFLVGHPRVDALVEAVAPRLSRPGRAALLRDFVRSATLERKQRTGQLDLKNGRHYEVAAVPLPDGAALVTMLDTTDSRQIEQVLRERAAALEEADRIKTAFVANMSYELRTPLTSIQGFAEMLQGKLAGPISPLAEDYIGAILQSAARLGTLIDNVLDLTQGDAGALPLERQPVELGPLLEAALASVADRAAAKSIDLVDTIAPALGQVEGDARRLRQAVDQLLLNAVAYTPPHGRVLLHAEGDAAGVLIVVSDNGPGMDAADQVRALDRFSRVGASAEAAPDRALGLGLPLAKHYVEGHGGTLSLISELGAGTAVQIQLPRQ